MKIVCANLEVKWSFETIFSRNADCATLLVLKLCQIVAKLVTCAQSLYPETFQASSFLESSKNSQDISSALTVYVDI